MTVTDDWAANTLAPALEVVTQFFREIGLDEDTSRKGAGALLARLAVNDLTVEPIDTVRADHAAAVAFLLRTDGDPSLITADGGWRRLWAKPAALHLDRRAGTVAVFALVAS